VKSLGFLGFFSGQWCISSIPIRLKSLGDGNTSRVNVDKCDRKRITYYIDSDEKVLELMRSAFELELIASEDYTDMHEFESIPKL